MKTFLRKTAEHLWAEHGIDELQDIAVVMPSQRGVLYLKKELAYLGDRPFLAPHFHTIEEFALQMTQSELVDPVQLILEAFACFKVVDGQVDFDRFITWGQLMLKDFDSIDMYLVDPRQMFAFLSEVKTLERWGETYGEKDTQKYITTHTKAYFKLYDHLLEVYGRLQTRLTDLGLAYRGMAYRDLVNRLVAGRALAKSYKKIYFIGFNALSKSEEEIIRLLIRQNLAETIWDADAYYIENRYHRAGHWLRDYAKAESPKFLSRGPFKWMGRDLLENPKRVELIGTANPSAQVFIALDTIRKWQAEHGSEEQVALVLADEGLLDQVLLFIGEFKDRLNITMGYSLKKTAIFSWMTKWFKIKKMHADGRISMAAFQEFIRHPLSRHVQTDVMKKDFITFCGQHKLYASSTDLATLVASEPVWKRIFQEGDFNGLLADFLFIADKMLRSIPAKEWDEDTQAISQVISVLETIQKSLSGHDPISFKSGSLLLTQMVQLQKLTFEGAENRSLHVMGLLETRTLDFDRVIILSLNEGSLPGTRKRESLIPLDIASMSTFDLPTFTQADAVASYHFHRLLQRPREVHLLYVMPSEKSSVKEMSRFIKQLQFDWKSKNPALDWHEPMIQFSTSTAGEVVGDTRIEKTEDILKQVKANLAGRGLSPSSIAMFSTCSLKYYYSQILNLRKDKEAEDEMGADVFGTWVHKVLEIVDGEILSQKEGWYDQSNVSERLAKLDVYLDDAMLSIQAREGVYELEKGFNFILKEVAKTILEQYYLAETAWSAERAQLIATEKKFETRVSVEYGQEDVEVKLTGRVDRLDRVGNTYRIIDYKTGKVEKKDLKVGDLGLMDTLTSENFKAKLFQLWFYKFLFTAELSNPTENNLEMFARISKEGLEIQPGIISFRNLDAQVLHEEKGLWFEEGQSLAKFKADSVELIRSWVHRILDPLIPFEKTKDIASCQFCDFKVICHREV
jgi:hypothetical protein